MRLEVKFILSIRFKNCNVYQLESNFGYRNDIICNYVMLCKIWELERMECCMLQQLERLTKWAQTQNLWDVFDKNFIV